jgi:hypothetical protein
MLAFHDIIQPGYPGVGIVWRSLREDCAEEFEWHEFVEIYEDVPLARLGIGLAIKRDATYSSSIPTSAG